MYDVNKKSSMKVGIDFGISFTDLSILDEFLTPNFSKTQLINRVGKFNYDNHTFSLPKRRINTFLTWKLAKLDLNINM